MLKTGKHLTGIFWGQLGMSMRSFICFGISILLARYLGASDFGVYSALVSLIAIVLRFTDMGVYSLFNNYLPRFASNNLHGEASYVIRKVILLKGGVFLLVAIGIYLAIKPLALFVGKPEVEGYCLLLIVWFVTRGTGEIFAFLMMSRMEMRFYSFIEISTSVLQLFGVLYLIQTGMDIKSLVVLMILVYGVQCLAYLYHTREAYLAPPQPTPLAPIAKFALTIWLAHILQYFLNNDIDIYLILHFLRDPSLAGYYNVAYFLSYSGGLVLTSSLSTLGLTILSESHANKGSEGLNSSLEFLYKLSIPLAAPILAFLLFQSGNLVKGFYGSGFSEAIPLVSLFSFFLLVSVFSGSGIIITALLPLNRERWVLYLRGAGGILNLLLNLLLIPVYGVAGAIIGTGVSFVVLALLEFIVVNRETGFRLPVVYAMKMVVVVMVPAALTLLLGEMGLAAIIGLSLLYAYIVLKLTFLANPLRDAERKMLQDGFPKLFSLLAALRILVCREVDIICRAAQTIKGIHQMTREELEALLLSDETDRIERTTATKDTEKFSEAICAFANDMPNHGKPGYLLIGVRDKGTLSGLRVTDETLKDLAALRNSGNIQPLPAMTVTKHSFPEGDIALVEVLPSHMPPVRYKGRTFIRVGPRKGYANEQEERILSERRVSSMQTFDASPCTEGTLNDLSLDLFMTYRRQAVAEEVILANHRDIKEQLAALRFWNTKLDCVTNAAILLFGTNPLFFLPGAYVQFLRIEGTKITDDIQSEKKISGDLATVLRLLDSLVTVNNETRMVRVEGSTLREEKASDYPEWAVRELLMNAIMHRDYQSNTPVRFYWYSDHIEINSPGGLYPVVTKENYTRTTSYRNPVIAETMKELGFVNRYGAGIQRALASLEKNGSPPAEFQFEDGFVSVILRKRRN